MPIRRAREVGVDSTVLRECRQLKGLSVHSLAEMASVCRGAIRTAEAGNPIPMDSLCRLSRALGLSVAALVGRSPDAHKQRLTELGYGAPPPPDDLVGRTHELEQSVAWLRDDKLACPVCVTGLQGLGKSAIASAIVEVVAARYPGGAAWVSLRDRGRDVWPRITAPNLARALGFYDCFAPQSDPRSEAWRESFLRLLSQRRTLMVLDDVSEEAHPEAIRRLGSACRLLLVTPSQRVVEEVQGAEIHLRPLSEPDAEKLIVQRLGGEVDPTRMEGLRRLVGVLPRTPKALCDAAAYLKRNRFVDPGDYADELSASLSRPSK